MNEGSEANRLRSQPGKPSSKGFACRQACAKPPRKACGAKPLYSAVHSKSFVVRFAKYDGEIFSNERIVVAILGAASPAVAVQRIS